MNKIFFPQGTLCIEDNQPVQEIAFSVCGGRKPAAAWLKMTAEKLPGTPEFFAADKGLDYYHAANIVPDKVIGDGDSADSLLWQQAVKSGKAEVFPVEAQIIAPAPSSLALVTAIVIPRSLKLPVGLHPSNFK